MTTFDEFSNRMPYVFDVEIIMSVFRIFVFLYFVGISATFPEQFLNKSYKGLRAVSD